MSEPRAQIEAELGADFEFLRELGAGEKSVVYLARESALRRLVAIKVLQPEHARDATTRERFGREGRAMASIRQRGVVDIFRVGALASGLPYMVMEYVHGRTLRECLESREPEPVERALDMLLQIATALETAHERGVIHRDLRPANVIEERETGRMVLTDFGLSGVAATHSISELPLTIDGCAPLGDPRYSSPEQLLADVVTESTDIYSLGIMAYELLTGKHPFESESRGGMRAAQLAREPEDLSASSPGIHPIVGRVLARCLSKRPRLRPTASEVRKSLERGLEDTKAELRPIAAGTTLSLFGAEIRRRRVGQVAIAYAATAFVVTQAAEQLVGPFPHLSWLHQLIVVVVLAGFAPAMISAWIFDITAKGIERTADEPHSHRLARRLRMLQAVSLVVLTAVVALVGWKLLAQA